MKCHYEDSNGHCWYLDHNGGVCEFFEQHREYGCSIARHEKMNQSLIQMAEQEIFTKPVIPYGEPVRPQFLRSGSLLR